MKPHCKDQAFARQLITQMNFGEVGRKPSTYRDAQSPKYDVPEAGEKWVMSKAELMCHPAHDVIETPAGYVRIHGVVPNKQRFEDCQVGDVVEIDSSMFNYLLVLHLHNVVGDELVTWSFERIWTDTSGNDKHYWKRTA